MTEVKLLTEHMRELRTPQLSRGLYAHYEFNIRPFMNKNISAMSTRTKALVEKLVPIICNTRQTDCSALSM